MPLYSQLGSFLDAPVTVQRSREITFGGGIHDAVKLGSLDEVPRFVLQHSDTTKHRVERGLRLLAHAPVRKCSRCSLIFEHHLQAEVIFI